MSDSQPNLSHFTTMDCKHRIKDKNTIAVYHAHYLIFLLFLFFFFILLLLWFAGERAALMMIFRRM